MNKDEVISKLTNLCEAYSDILCAVILFGSYSRDEATDKSDIDLYIEPRDVSMTTSKFGAHKRQSRYVYPLGSRM